MKLVSWNVNGIRAADRSGLREWVARERPDVLCLQEVKLGAEPLDPELREPPGYQSFWHPAERPGYSGVATFSRPAPSSVKEGLGDPELDREGRVLITEHADFVLVNAYFPNSRHGGSRLWYKLRFCNRLMRLLRRLRAADRPAVVCGDYNIAHREIDLANAKANKRNAGFLPEERAWLDRLLQAGYVDAFRTLHPDERCYSWWSYRSDVRARNIGWRVDYFWIDERLRPRLQNAFHRTETRGSDHCPIGIELALPEGYPARP